MSELYDGPRAVTDQPAAGLSGRGGGDDMDDTVARLLGLAGRRPSVPIADAAAVKAAARIEWQRTVWAQRRRKLVLRGAGGLLAAAALLAVAIDTGVWERLRPVPAATVATVELVSGRLLEGGVALAPGAVLRADAIVETERGDADAAARAALRLAGGASLRLDAGSRLRLLSSTVMALERGAVYIDSDSLGTALEVRTPLGVAHDIGTQFEVRLEGDGDALRVRVREGTVVLDRGGERRRAEAGIELTVQRDGTLVEAPVPTYGATWAWAIDARPPFDGAGRSLLEVLEWAAREGGWSLRFADPALEARAGEVILHDSGTGGSLENRVGRSLMGANLHYRLADGVLYVER